MEPVEVKRLDHHGVVACVIDDLEIVEIIDERIPSDGQEDNVANGYESGYQQIKTIGLHLAANIGPLHQRGHLCSKDLFTDRIEST